MIAQTIDETSVRWLRGPSAGAPALVGPLETGRQRR
jgi:hypothetical protein